MATAFSTHITQLDSQIMLVDVATLVKALNDTVSKERNFMEPNSNKANPSKLIFILLFAICTCGLILGSISNAEQIEQTEPKVDPVWTEDKHGNPVQLQPLFNFSPYAYRSNWSCGWPFSLFTVEASDVETQELPYSLFHNLKAIQLNWLGCIGTLILLIPVSLLAAIGLHTAFTKLELRITIRFLFVLTGLIAYHLVQMQKSIEYEFNWDNLSVATVETFIRNVAVPMSYMIAWVALVVACYPKIIARWWHRQLDTKMR